MVKTSRQNANRQAGKAAEDLVASICLRYQMQGILKLSKVGPPFRYFFNPRKGALDVIFQPSEHTDYVGAWTERGGRLLSIEVKSTQEDRLQTGTESGGLKQSQINAMINWSAMGAAAGLLWVHAGQMRFLSLLQILRLPKINGRKYIKFEEAQYVPDGKGFVIHDFVKTLRVNYPSWSEAK